MELVEYVGEVACLWFALPAVFAKTLFRCFSKPTRVLKQLASF
jgi:hypothetical protein